MTVTVTVTVTVPFNDILLNPTQHTLCDPDLDCDCDCDCDHDRDRDRGRNRDRDRDHGRDSSILHACMVTDSVPLHLHTNRLKDILSNLVENALFQVILPLSIGRYYPRTFCRVVYVLWIKILSKDILLCCLCVVDKDTIQVYSVTFFIYTSTTITTTA